MVDQMRENTLRFPLFREALGSGRSGISCSTGSVKNVVLLSLDAMGRESDFHDFLRAEELFLFDTPWGMVGEDTCLGKGSVVWGLQHFGSFKDFGKPQLGNDWDKGWAAPCVCHGETAGVKPQLLSAPLARQGVGPASTKLWSNLELSLYLSFSPRLYYHTGF